MHIFALKHYFVASLLSFGSPFRSPFGFAFGSPFGPFEALLYFKTYVQVTVKQYEGMGVFRLFFDKTGHSGPCHSVHFRDNKAFEGYFCHYCLNSWPFCVKKSVSLAFKITARANDDNQIFFLLSFWYGQKTNLSCIFVCRRK